jgi:uncharacterized SAM-binding protein YcdF (DUF218 family)
MSTTIAPTRVPPTRGAPERSRRRSGFARFLLFLLALAVAACLLAAGSVVAKGREYDTTVTDAIVVLGASQYWGKPSPVLANRLDYAAELYREGVAPVIVTVGGGIPGDKTTEAQAGANYLVAKGIPADAVVAVPQGRDTVGSLEAVRRRAKRAGWESVTLVSDRAHLARSKAIADALGLDGHVNGPASGDGALLTPEYVARETAGLMRFYAWDRWQIPGVG